MSWIRQYKRRKRAQNDLSSKIQEEARSAAQANFRQETRSGKQKTFREEPLPEDYAFLEDLTQAEAGRPPTDREERMFEEAYRNRIQSLKKEKHVSQPPTPPSDPSTPPGGSDRLSHRRSKKKAWIEEFNRRSSSSRREYRRKQALFNDLFGKDTKLSPKDGLMLVQRALPNHLKAINNTFQKLEERVEDLEEPDAYDGKASKVLSQYGDLLQSVVEEANDLMNNPSKDKMELVAKKGVQLSESTPQTNNRSVDKAFALAGEFADKLKSAAELIQQNW